MSDKEKEIAGLIVGAIRAGYKITFERNDIGAAKGGTHVHIGFIDELVNEVGTNPFDYINQELIKGEQK
jgi:hypothetical protein